MKRLFLIIALFFILFALPSKAEAAGTFTIGATNYIVDGQQQVMDVAPYIKDGRTFLPVRYGAYALGLSANNILWDSSSQTITLMKNSTVVKLQAGSNTMFDNGVNITMDVAPEITMDRVMLPLSYIAIAFDQTISWNPNTQTVTIANATPNSMNYPSKQSLDIIVPSLSYNNIQTENKDFEWTYGGNSFKWHVEIPSDLINWDRQINNLTQQFYNSDGLEQHLMQNSMQDNIIDLVLSNSTSANDNLSPWVNETNNSKWVGYLADDLSACAHSSGYDYFHQADFILSFIGSAIPYKSTTVAELPAQTLLDSGDCKDKSILYAAILKSLDYKVALLCFPSTGDDSGHMAVGVALSNDQLPQGLTLNYYPHNGQKYYFAETTESGWTLGAVSNNSPAYIYEIN